MWRRRFRQKHPLRRNKLSLSHEVQYIALMQWMKENGFSCKNCCLTPAEFPDTGRGLMTRKKLKTGDTVVEIPSSLLITTQTVLETDVGQVIRRQHHKPTPQQVICIFLITERSKGRASFWHPYINVLPKDFTTPASCFTERSDFDYLPEPARTKALVQLDDIRLAFQDASAVFEDVERTFPQFHGLFDFESFVWAWFVINSRSVYMEQDKCNYLKAGSKNDFALAPFLDLLNHSPTAEVAAGYSISEGCYQIKTLQTYRPYEQVFIHYGPHDNTNLLLEYGFLIPGNQHEAVTFDLDTVLNAWKCGNSRVRLDSRFIQQTESALDRKASLLKSEHLSEDLSCTREGPSWRLLTVLRVLCMDFQELQSWKRIIASDNSSPSSSQSKQLIAAAVTKLTDDCIAEVHRNLKRLCDPGVERKAYLEPVKVLWEERLDILRATQAAIRT